MHLVIESTDETPVINGVECRLWKGHTEKGAECLVFVHRIAVADGQDASEFEAGLLTKGQPADWPPSNNRPAA